MLLVADRHQTANHHHSIARYVLERYSQPFDTVLLNGLHASPSILRIAKQALRHPETYASRTGLESFLTRVPDHCFHLILFDPSEFLSDDTIQQSNLLYHIMRVLQPGGNCMFVASDSRRNGKIVPNGFRLVHRFMAAQFQLARLIGQAADDSLPFHLHPHQYLAVFRKPLAPA
ncbi:hypothetical protein [Effusibacillus dendaii]|uniref:Methyltransferase domain-containing protein n=1 Tax=Effusibacillus dendaii TaxID=2743772 RepID=A0A7I8D941_9BACL|nr:hypothetical protein [Effusibacillus dendaii]BCJ85336.1 hypothetical protein skT53_03210 [Effusibacillus dendaii]